MKNPIEVSKLGIKFKTLFRIFVFMKNKILSICIPTFNRPKVLKKNILSMIEELKKFSIPIFISDESNNNETEILITEIKKIYKYIFYFKQIKKLGHDKNVFHSLSLPKTEYIWLLSDSVFVNKNAIENVLNIINAHKPDLIAVNSHLRELDIKKNFYTNASHVLNDLGWHLTWTGATIYSKNVISSSNKIDKTKYTNFPQIALIFTHLSGGCNFYWENNNLISSTKKDKSYWSENIFNVWLEDWRMALNNLPSCYAKSIKEKVFLEHSIKTGLFNIKSLLNLRSLGILNINTFRKYNKLLGIHSGKGTIVMWLILLIPKNLLLILKKIIKRVNY